MRLFGQTSTKALVEGLYNVDSSAVSDECFGDWMVTTWNDIDKTTDAILDDPFSVSWNGYMDYSTNWMSLLVKNADKCQWKKVTDDLQNWCLENKEVCLLQKGLEQRIWDNATDIVTAMVDIMRMMEVDDECFDVKE